MDNAQLLELLRGEVDDSALRQAVERVRRTGEDLASACYQLRLAKERPLVKGLARLLGYPGIDLSGSVIRLSNLELVPQDVMKRKLVLPVLDLHGELIVAMADPDDAAVYDQLRFLTGRKVLRHVGLPAALKQAIEQMLPMQANGETEWRGKDAYRSNPPPEGRAAVVHPLEPGEQALPQAELVEDLPVVAGSPVPAGGSAGPAWLEELFQQPELPRPPPRAAPVAQARPVAPLDQAANPLDVPTLKVDALGSGKTVLVVDDDPDMRALELKLLKPFGCATAEAGDGKEALQLCRELQPDLVLLDAMLPGMHGFEVCRAVKGDPTLRKTGVIMLSGIYTGWKIGVDVKEVYGADHFFEKPFRVDEVSRAVRLMLLGGAGDQAVAAARRKAALDLCKEAHARSRDGKPQEAAALLQAAAQKDPFAAEPHFFLGQVLARLKEPYQAVAALERAAELRPDLDQPLALLGDLYLQLGFKKTAREVLTRALAVCPDPKRSEDLKRRLAGLQG